MNLMNLVSGCPVTFATILICAIVYFRQNSDPSFTGKYLNNSYMIQQGQYYRLLTGGFLHGGPWHIMMNLYSLYNLGPWMERMLGPAKFLLLSVQGQVIARTLRRPVCRDVLLLYAADILYDGILGEYSAEQHRQYHHQLHARRCLAGTPGRSPVRGADVFPVLTGPASFHKKYCGSLTAAAACTYQFNNDPPCSRRRKADKYRFLFFY